MGVTPLPADPWCRGGDFKRRSVPNAFDDSLFIGSYPLAIQ